MSRVLSPIEAYERAEQQKRRLGEAFRKRIVRLARGGAMRRILAARDDEAAICAAYRAVAMAGARRIDPAKADFEAHLRAFHRNYVTNFPLPEEQETLDGFRRLWRAPARADGYREVGYNVVCPLTGRYLLGAAFTIQPQSDSVTFIYGFVNPVARGIGGFSAALIGLMREQGRAAIATHLERRPADRPGYHDPAGPLILFEKNVLEAMSLTDILMDTARVSVDDPPRTGACLAASSIGQSMRDLVWHRRGARIVDYAYAQGSLDGVVRVAAGQRHAVIAALHAGNGAAPELLDALGDRVAGCVALNLCAFVADGVRVLRAAQVRRSQEVFQGISVVKDEANLGDDIYFQAQMASLDASTRHGAVALRPIAPVGAGDFHGAEAALKQVLSGLTWADLRAARGRAYGDWLRVGGGLWDGGRQL